MRYYNRSHVDPDRVMEHAADYFGSRLAPENEGARLRRYSGSLGAITISVKAEGGHYTLVTIKTDQPGESELDRLAKRFMGEVHTLEHTQHALRGAY